MHLDRESIHWLSSTLYGLYAAKTAAGLATVTLASLRQRHTLILSSVEELSHAGSSYALHGLEVATPFPAEAPRFCTIIR
jgi:hypothetical protein